MSIIQADRISYSFKGTRIVKAISDVSLSVEKGEFVSFIGVCGSGKTTLARHFNALLCPDSGKISICGFESADEENEKNIRRACAMVFSDSPDSFVMSKIGEELAFSLWCFDIDGAEAEEMVRNALELTGLTGRENERLSSLNEYDALLVQLAAVLAVNPEIIVLDDPMKALSGDEKKRIFALLRGVNEQGKTIILFTHDYAEAAEAQRSFILGGGELIASGKTREVLTTGKLLDIAGIEQPFPLRVYNDLKKSGIDLENVPLSMEELVDELCR